MGRNLEDGHRFASCQARAGNLILSQKVKTQCDLTKDTLAAEDGLDQLIVKLRELYAASKEQAMFAGYEKFENFCRPQNMKITDYINEFERMYSVLKNYHIELPTVVLCYRLLKSANLPKERRDLARATIAELTYEAMKKQIKAIYDHCSSNSDASEEVISHTEEEENNVLYAGSGSSSMEK